MILLEKIRPALHKKKAILSNQSFLGTKNSNEQIFVILIIASLWCFIFQEYILFKKAFVFNKFAIDTISQFYPIEYYKINELLSGNFPWWSFQFDLGTNVYSIFANLNPFDIIYLFFGKDHFVEAIPYVVLLKFITTGLFFHAFLKQLKINSTASLIGAILFTFSGYMMVNSHWYHYTNYAVFSAAFLYYFEIWVQKGRWLPIVLLLGLVSLKGELQLFQLACFGSGYVLYRGVTLFGWSTKIIKLFILLALFFTLGVLVNSYILLPDLAEILSSSRAGSAMQDASTVETLTKIFTPISWKGLSVIVSRVFANDLLGSWIGFRGIANYFEDSTFYIGILAALFIPISLVIGNRINRILWIFPLVFIAICTFPYFISALNGFASSTYKYITLYGSFYILFPFIIIIDKILSGSISKKVFSTIKIFLSFYLSFSLTVLLYIIINGYYLDIAHINKTLLWKTVLFISLYSLSLLSFSQRGCNIIKFILLILVVSEVALFSRGTALKNPGTVNPFFQSRGEYYFNPDTLSAISYIKQKDTSLYRIEKDYNDGHLNDSLIQNYYGTQAYFGFVSGGVVKFYEKMSLSKDSPRLASYRYGLEGRSALQTLLGVKYFLSKTETNHQAYEDFVPIKTFGSVQVQRKASAAPFGHIFYTQIQDEEFSALPEKIKDSTLLRTVVTETVVPQVNHFVTEQKVHTSHINTNLNESPAVKVSYDGKNTVRSSLETIKPGILFLPIPYDRGWKAHINNSPAHLLQVNYGFIGLEIPKAGKHEVLLKYTPPLLTEGILLSLLSLLSALGIWKLKPTIKV